MQAFSSTVAELYERAAHTGPRAFPAEAIQLVRRLIAFDGAILGIGNAEMALAKNLVIDQACVNRGVEPIQDVYADNYADISFGTLLLPIYTKGLDKPLACDWQEMDREQEVPQWRDLVRRHDMRKLLVYGDSPVGHHNARWIMLYRVADHDFHDADGTLLHALWRHLTQAITFNLGRALNRSDPNRISRAMALINSRGLLEVADQAMSDLLKLEWPDFDERRLPITVVSALVENGVYHGKRIELTGFQKYGYMACIARRITLIKSLAPSEMNVAHRFARGMTHKEIAAHLKVSPHTVRNQIAQVYLKLGVHDKAELARLMSSS